MSCPVPRVLRQVLLLALLAISASLIATEPIVRPKVFATTKPSGRVVRQISWDVIGWVWFYNLIWMAVQDAVKIALYQIVESGGAGALPFLQLLRQPLYSHAGVHHQRHISRTSM